MKLKILLVAVFVAGLVVSFAIAAPPPGKDKGKGKGRNAGAAATSSSTTGSTTTTAGKKTLICHRTHSKKKPYRLISVSNKAVPAHLRHGDVLPTNGQCPSSVGTTTTTTTTSSTTSTTTSTSTTTTSASPQKKKHP